MARDDIVDAFANAYASDAWKHHKALLTERIVTNMTPEREKFVDQQLDEAREAALESLDTFTKSLKNIENKFKKEVTTLTRDDMKKKLDQQLELLAEKSKTPLLAANQLCELSMTIVNLLRARREMFPFDN